MTNEQPQLKSTDKWFLVGEQMTLEPAADDAHDATTQSRSRSRMLWALGIAGGLSALAIGIVHLAGARRAPAPPAAIPQLAKSPAATSEPPAPAAASQAPAPTAAAAPIPNQAKTTATAPAPAPAVELASAETKAPKMAKPPAARHHKRRAASRHK
jgi:hypothetical protein